jgi:hypothetical protein
VPSPAPVDEPSPAAEVAEPVTVADVAPESFMADSVSVEPETVDQSSKRRYASRKTKAE